MCGQSYATGSIETIVVLVRIDGQSATTSRLTNVRACRINSSFESVTGNKTDKLTDRNGGDVGPGIVRFGVE